MLFLRSMKFFLTIMVIALAFSGYSAASHAMGTKDCSSKAGSQLEECQHTDASTDKDHAQKHDKKEAKCMDCTHCCASSAAISPVKQLNFSMTGAVFAPEPSRAQPQGRFFSLLRPPRTLA